MIGKASSIFVPAILMAVFAVSPVRGTEVTGYYDSEGNWRPLFLSHTKVAVVAGMEGSEPLAQVTIRHPMLQYGSVSRKAGGVLLCGLAENMAGRQLEVARRLAEEGFSRRIALVFEIPGDPDKTFTLDNTLVVKPKDADAAALAGTCGVESIEPLDNRANLWTGRARDALAVLEACRCLHEGGYVKWALPDFSLPVRLYGSVNDTYFGNQWHLAQSSDADIDADEAWDVTMGDVQVAVAIVDTGVETDHPDFEPARMLPGYNAATDTSDPTPLPTAIDAHGTACAGAVAAWSNNGQGVAGVCPGCSLIPIKMMDGMSTEAQLSTGYRAINFAADNGAWVISNSWGIPQDYTSQVDMEPYREAIRHAVNEGRGGLGAVVLFASGNGNQWGQAQEIGADELQNMPEVMAVGGTGPDDTVVGYSNYGPNLSVVAPTGDMDPLSFTNPFKGPQITTTDTTGNQGFSRNGTYWTVNPFSGEDVDTGMAEIDSSGDYTQYFNGTSAACPIAAGVVALVFSANPALTGAQARLIVEQTADKVGGANYDAQGHDEHYGYGRVNAARAVRVAVLGLDNADFSECVHDLNCESGHCHLPQGSQQGQCITPCESDDQCAAGGRCASLPDGTAACVYSCEEDAQCTPPALCLPYEQSRTCQQVECTDGSECFDGTACPYGGGYCMRQCAGEQDCPDGSWCLQGGGGSVCQSIACVSDEQCPEGAECGPDGLCIPQEGGGCGCASGTGGSLAALVLLLVGLCSRRRRG